MDIIDWLLGDEPSPCQCENWQDTCNWLAKQMALSMQTQRRFADKAGIAPPGSDALADEKQAYAMLIHMVREAIEAAQLLPSSKPWKTDADQAVLGDANARKAYLTEMADIFLFFTASLCWAGIKPAEMAEAIEDKRAYNAARSDHAYTDMRA